MYSQSLLGMLLLYSDAYIFDIILSLRVDTSKPRPLAHHGISCYLCPNQEQNPWCPTRPGMHGYMFVGLGLEADTFVEPETRHLFVGIAVRQYRYLGLYEVTRVKDNLTLDEWKALPDSVGSNSFHPVILH